MYNKMGMGGFGGGNNMQALMRQAQKMQEEMTKKMEEAEEKLNETILTSTAGGGIVEVKINGHKKLQSIKIKPEAVDPEDVEMLEDLILACVNDAILKADEEEQKLKGNGLPQGLNGLF